jgi:hypothetical protein
VVVVNPLAAEIAPASIRLARAPRNAFFMLCSPRKCRVQCREERCVEVPATKSVYPTESIRVRVWDGRSRYYKVTIKDIRFPLSAATVPKSKKISATPLTRLSLPPKTGACVAL